MHGPDAALLLRTLNEDVKKNSRWQHLRNHLKTTHLSAYSDKIDDKMKPQITLVGFERWPKGGERLKGEKWL